MLEITRNPWKDLEDLRNHLVADGDTRGGRWLPATDIVEDNQALHITVDMPGIDADSLAVSSEQNVLSISARREAVLQKEDDKVYYQGRAYGEFTRHFNVSNSYDLGKIEAAYKDGVLALSIPRSPESAPRKIEVAVN